MAEKVLERSLSVVPDLHQSIVRAHSQETMSLTDTEARAPLVQCYLPREFPGFEVVDLQASIRFVVGE